MAVTAVLCAAVVKKQAREIALVLSLAAGALILRFALQAVWDLRALMDQLTGLAGLSPAVTAPVLKTVGISILARVTAELCRDAGESGIAAFVETTAAGLALCAAVPLLRAVLTSLDGLF